MEKYAFVLGGGGARGAYEIGVWQALRELDIPIHIVTGSSVGALNGVLVAQNRFDDAVNLWKDLETHMVFDIEEGPFDFQIGNLDTGEILAYLKEIFTNSGAGTSGLDEIVRNYVDESMVRNSNIDFGLVTVEVPSLKPHYVFTADIPQGKLGDYVIASAACFPAIEARDIDDSTFIDGGYADVLPVQMAVDRGANHIIAVYLDGAGKVKKDRLEYAREHTKSFHLIQSKWNLGSILTFDKDNTQRIMRLGYLDAMKAFEQYEGQKYTFQKNTFTLHQLAGAEAAAELFELDPLLIYDEALLRNKLADNLEDNPMVVQIAQSLQKKEADSYFLSKQAFKMLREEVQAANFLLQQNII